MDVITQAAIGAAAGQSPAAASRLRVAALAGALGGFLPDSDVLIRSSSDPLLFLEYHRHFTHALAFIPIGGAITAGLLQLFSRGRLGFRSTYLPATLGWATHGLLDSCTSYGTSLLLPFSNTRVAWHSISIIDPLFTLPLLAGVFLALRRCSPLPARLGLATALLYLAFSWSQLSRAETIHEEIVAARGHEALRGQVKPSFGTNILFRAFYEHDGRYYADAIRVPWFGAPRVYPGTSHPSLDLDDYARREGLDSLARSDLQRFAFFSDGFVIEDPSLEGVLSDFRYALVPNSVAPLWGIVVGGRTVGEHLKWVENHDLRASDRALFFSMLLGEDTAARVEQPDGRGPLPP